MSRINEDLTRKVADLARLELSEAEVSTFSAQLQAVVAYVDQLAQVEVTGVEPLVHPLELDNPWREDEARPSPRDERGHPRTLEAAPETVDGGFRVPPIL